MNGTNPTDTRPISDAFDKTIDGLDQSSYNVEPIVASSDPFVSKTIDHETNLSLFDTNKEKT